MFRRITLLFSFVGHILLLSCPVLSCPFWMFPMAGGGGEKKKKKKQTKKVADRGSAECAAELLEDGTLIGLYLLIAGIVMVVFTLAWVVLQKHYGMRVRVKNQADRVLRA